MQDGGGGVDEQRSVCGDLRVVPALAQRPDRLDHVVGEGLAEAGVAQHLLALDLGEPVVALGDGEVEPHVLVRVVREV